MITLILLVENRNLDDGIWSKWKTWSTCPSGGRPTYFRMRLCTRTDPVHENHRPMDTSNFDGKNRIMILDHKRNNSNNNHNNHNGNNNGNKNRKNSNNDDSNNDNNDEDDDNTCFSINFKKNPTSPSSPTSEVCRQISPWCLSGAYSMKKKGKAVQKEDSLNGDAVEKAIIVTACAICLTVWAATASLTFYRFYLAKEKVVE